MDQFVTAECCVEVKGRVEIYMCSHMSRCDVRTSLETSTSCLIYRSVRVSMQGD
jgi:hypothetical protein